MNSNQLLVDNSDELRGNYIARGFEAKSEGQIDLAVKNFLAALEISPPPDLELMLSFDIFAMCREIGQYDRAREVLNRFVKKGYPGASPSDIEEINTNLKHLDLIHEMLLKANTPNLPFSKIPVLIKISAEEKISEWKNETA